MSPETLERIQALAEKRKKLLGELRTKPSGVTWCQRHAQIADEVVAVLFDDLVATGGDLPPIALIATGGYGRRELSPLSDIDITVVPLDESAPGMDAAIRNLFRDLHSAFVTSLGLEVGYAYRLISDAPGLDGKTRTGLLDMRLVAGSIDLFNELDEALVQSFHAGEFILTKLKEREEMFAKFHDTPLVAEPHLKEGAGGLRCFQCSNWLGEAIGDRPARPTHAYDRIILARNILHLVAGRPYDLLTRGRQQESAEIMGQDVYEMMSDIAKAGIELHDWYRRATEKLKETRFLLSPDVLSVMGEVRLVGQPNGGTAAVGVAIATQIGLHVADLPLVASKQVDGPAALYAFSTGETTLRNLDRCKLLGQLLPELDACRTLMPTDSVHVYTIFEHTMRVVRNLDSIDPNSFYGEIKAGLNDLEPLYLAALLHDVGKITEDRPHSVVGAEIARDVCARWELAEEVCQTVEWLVLEHLSMSRVIGLRDIMNPLTIEEFAAAVHDTDRLGLLTLLTWADASAVSSNTWTQAQDSFLRELYVRTSDYLKGHAEVVVDATVHRQRLLRQLKSVEQDEESVKSFVESLPAHYLTSTPPNVIRLHMEFATKASGGTPTVELFHRPEIGATELTVCAKDKAGLLSVLLGILYAFDLSILSIRASTTMTEEPVALDVFTVSFGGRPVPPATSQQVSKSVMDVLEGRKTIEEVLKARGKDPTRNQKVFSYAYHEGAPGILEIRSPRGRGMPYRFSRLLSQQGWNIVSARVGQWAGSAAASFYLLGPKGKPISKAAIDEVLGSISK